MSGRPTYSSSYFYMVCREILLAGTQATFDGDAIGLAWVEP